MEFLTEWRDDEYIRQYTKGMNPEEVRRCALSYSGWDDEDVSQPEGELSHSLEAVIIEGKELPFR